MTSRERVWAAINREPVDRIPTDIWATAEVYRKLVQHFGGGADLRAELHIDGFAGVSPAYIGPPLPGGPTIYGIFGIETKPVPHKDGVYEEQSVFPLAEAATIDDLERFPWPTTDWFDYAPMLEQARELSRHQVVMSGYMAPFYFHNLLRGLEQSLVDPLSDPAFTHHLLGRLCDFFYDHHRRIFEACDGRVDIAQVTDDLGSQTGPMMSLAMYKQFYAPHHKRFIDLCREFGVKVFHHDDGSCRLFLPELVSMGIDVLNPVQWTCPDMDMDELKKEYGGRVCFHGGIENQQILPFGTPDEVRAEVRHCIDALGGDGTGYILASCHNLQVNTPVENIVAMYDEAYHYGQKTT